jgi:phage-related protein (TIGR01555 family)
MSKENKYTKFCKAKLDSWVSTLTGSGTTADKTASFQAYAYIMSPTTAKNLYRASGTAKVIVDLPAEEACRAGYKVEIPEDPKLAQQLQSKMETLKAPEALQEALRLCRMCGGSLVYMATDDADVTKPLTPKSKVKALRALGAGDVTATQEYTSSLDSPNFALPAFYSIDMVLPGVSLGLDRVHYSRFLRMAAPVVDGNDLIRRQGFGAPVLEALKDSIQGQETALSSVATLMVDVSVGTLSIPGLNAAMASVTELNTDGIDLIRARLQMLDKTRSVHHSVVLDAGDGIHPAETFTRVSTPLSGIPEVLDRLAQKVSQDSRIPLSILTGVGATGLLNNGSESTMAFRSYVQTLQTTYLRPCIERLVVALTGLQEPDSYTITFAPLAVPSAKEQAETNNTQATADCAYVVNGVLTAEEVRASRFGDKPSLSTQVEDVELPETTKETE